MPTFETPVWQLVLGSAVVSTTVSLVLLQLTDFFRHKRTKVEHFEKMMLDRKFEALNRVWKATHRLTTDISPFVNGNRAFKLGETLTPYQQMMREEIKETFNAFDENTLILGEPVQKVWTKYKHQLMIFDRFAEEKSAAYMRELQAFCLRFPADLKEAIKETLHDPKISILSVAEEKAIREEADGIVATFPAPREDV